MGSRRVSLALLAFVLPACGTELTSESQEIPIAEESDAGSPASRADGSPVPPGNVMPPAICSIGEPEPMATLLADLPVDIEVARLWTIEACKDNAGCWVTRADADLHVQNDAASSYIAPAFAAMGSSNIYVELRLRRASEERSYVEVFWSSLGAAADGDRFTIKAVDTAGTTHELLDERVDYRIENKSIGPGCAVRITQATVDKRAPSDADAGI